ncbi:MAG: aconitase/3-isopropylmalate dehydratase large subunit family protein [Aminipila sp.]
MKIKTRLLIIIAEVINNMGMTIAEKIIAAAAGVETVKPGDIHTVTLDRMMSNDGTTHLTIDMYNQQIKNPTIADTGKLVFIVDHNVPADNPKTAASHKKMRDFAKQHNIDFWEGKGVCHQIMMENYVCPGELIFGADSHTCTYGALGAFGTGVGCTDFLYGMVTGTSWVLVPETVKFNLIGKLKDGVYPRDLMLHIIGKIGANGVNYQVMEFTGDGTKSLSVNDRMVLCNLAVEAGAKSAIFEADEIALSWLKEHRREPKHVFKSDADANYFKEYTFDLNEIEPIVAKPDFVDDVIPAKEACGTKIDEAFLGSCNNGRIDEMRVAARLLKGRKVSDTVRFLIVPASNEVYMQALDEGLIEIFMEAGAIVMNANCSVCWGSCQGVIGENEVLISTGTRNFKGRAGHPTSKVYLGSAATVTASAIKGAIATEDQL